MEMDQSMRVSGLDLGEAETAMSMTMDTTQRVQELDGSGNGIIVQNISNTSVTVSVNRQPVPAGDMSSLLDDLSMTMTITPIGVVTESHVNESDNPQINELIGMLDESFSQMTLEFPERMLSIGDTWNVDAPFDLEQPGVELDSNTTATYRFIGYANHEGRQLVVLESNVEMSLSGEFEELGSTTTASGTGEGHGYTYFDNGSGKLERGVMDMSMSMSITAEGTSLQQEMRMNISIDRQE
jgi:hypothetical protein